MKAIILAGGRGVRIASLAASEPKPLIKVGPFPVVHILIRQLVAHGFNKVTLSVGTFTEHFERYRRNYWSSPELLDLSLIDEEEPTGTAGSLSLVPDLNETFLVVNGDILTTLDFVDLIAFHRRGEAALTIAVQRRAVQVEFGVLDIDDKGAVTNYREKPRLEYQGSMGIYVCEPRILKYMSRGAYIDFPDLVLRLLTASERVSAYVANEQWFDIGSPAGYQDAVQEFEKHPDLFLGDSVSCVRGAE